MFRGRHVPQNEAACEEWNPENVRLCAERQDGILDCAASMLAPGGRIVYSTCTFAPAENEGSMTRFLLRHPEFHIVEVKSQRVCRQEYRNGLISGKNGTDIA